MPETPLSSRIQHIVIEDEDGKKIRIDDDREGGIPKWLMPVLTAVATTAAIGAFTFAWNTSKDMALIKAQQNVSPIEFTRMQGEIDRIKERYNENRSQDRADLDRLREWMKNHTHGGTARMSDSPPAAVIR